MTENTQLDQRSKEEQQLLNNFTAAFASLFGAEVIPREHYVKIYRENEKLLEQTRDLNSIRERALHDYCKLASYQKYHDEWKPITRKIKRRTQQLINQNLIYNFTKIPLDVHENLDEAYKCYVHGQEIACYVMLLRTVEIVINHLYDPLMSPNKNKVPIKQKLEWVNNNGYLSGADYFVMKGFLEGRNEAIHTVFQPTEKQLYSAFETVINLVKRIDENDNKSNI